MNYYCIPEKCEELFCQLERSFDINTEMFVVYIMPTTSDRIISISLKKILYASSSSGTCIAAHAIGNLGYINERLPLSADQQFDAGVIEYLMSKGVNFNYPFSLVSATRINHRKLKKLFSRDKSLLSTYNEILNVAREV